MNSLPQLTLIEGSYKNRLATPAVSALAAPRDYPARALMVAVTLHVVALVSLFYTAEQKAGEIPVLAFTVTLMDMGSSPNSLSSAASTPSAMAEASQEESKAEEIKPVERASTPQKTVKKKTTPSPKSATQTHSSVQQTAVLAPVVPAQFDAAYLNNPTPKYPPLSRRLGEQGSVLLSVYVNEQGRAENLQLRKSSGFSRLDNAALETVSGWRFASARQGERLVASWVQVPVKFVLE